jgi:hypothetical protein
MLGIFCNEQGWSAAYIDWQQTRVTPGGDLWIYHTLPLFVF